MNGDKVSVNRLDLYWKIKCWKTKQTMARGCRG